MLRATDADVTGADADAGAQLSPNESDWSSGKISQ